MRNWLDACWLTHIACGLYTIVLSAQLSLVMVMRRRMGDGSVSESTRGRDRICVSRVVIWPLRARSHSAVWACCGAPRRLPNLLTRRPVAQAVEALRKAIFGQEKTQLE